MELFDTHTHLNADQFVGKVPEVVDEARAHDVKYIAIVGFDKKTIERSLQLSNEYNSMISVIGWHPTEVRDYTPEVEYWLEERLTLPNVKMLGEIGLDYHWHPEERDEQMRVFRRQIAIAKEHHLPITIHNREATEDVYRILKEEGLPQRGGIMHSFGGTIEEAYRFLDLGMHISMSGVLTFKKSDELRQLVAQIPQDRLLIETDAPYLAPVPYRGKENQPAYVRYVAQMIAEVRQQSLEEVARFTAENAMKLFQWDGR